MKNALFFAAALVIGCSSSTPPADAGADAAPTDAATEAAPKDAAAPTDAGDAGTCAPPQGASCPTTGGNCLHIGQPCTKGGGQCPQPTACDIDLDPTGVGICITYFSCKPNMHECGAGATCCQTAMTSNTPVCLPNQCLPSDCTAEP
ncbi:MAG TPA: hypothetical protein VGH28_25005 [Polyangiaceae bacterium]|jgi:hypothetical protein